MDFNLILLVIGLGLLGLVILYALWGFFGGLKRELTCVAVLLVLLLLAWLIFGDPAILMNSKGSLASMLQNALKVSGENLTVWGVILQYGKTIIPNGAELLQEGKEAYDLFYSIASGVIRGIGLISITVVVLVITPIIRLITHIVWLIVRAVKKNKAKANVTEVATENEAQPVKVEETVVVSQRQDGYEDTVVTLSENELPKSKDTKKRLWGAGVGALKGFFVMVLIFIPLSGITSVLGSVSTQSRNLLSDLVDGKKIELANTNDNMADLAFDFADAYQKSAIGKFMEGSAYFFGDSFSSMMFDSTFRVTTKTQSIALRKELNTFIAAFNALDGKTKLGSWTDKEFAAAMDALKESKLLPEMMPAGLEYAFEQQVLKDALEASGQIDQFLNLRNINWKNDLKNILEALKVAYQLDIFAADFNVLTMDSKTLQAAIDLLGQTELINKGLPIAIQAGLKLDSVEKLIGSLEKAPELDQISWSKELNVFVSVYELFQKLGIEDLKAFDINAFLQDVLDDETKTQVVVDLLNKAFELQLVPAVGIPAGIGYVLNDPKLSDVFVTSGQVDNFKKLQSANWANDMKRLTAALQKATELFEITDDNKINMDYFNLDTVVLREVFNQLGHVSSMDLLVKLGVNLWQKSSVITNATISANWVAEFNRFVDIYENFKLLGFQSIEDFNKQSFNDLLASIIDDDVKFTALGNILEALAETDSMINLVSPVGEIVLNQFLEANQFADFANILQLQHLTKEQWHEDFNTILDVVTEANALNAFSFKLEEMDITSDFAITTAKQLIDQLFGLHIINNETKTKLMEAVIKRYELGEDVVLDDVVWTKQNENEISEADVLKNIIDIYAKLIKFDEVDMGKVQFDWNGLLEKDGFYELVVELLEQVVESNVSLAILPGAINKFVTPMLDNIDDDHLLDDILDQLESKEIVNEIKKLIDAAIAAKDLGVLKVGKDGIAAIDFANTAAMKDVINLFFDSKLIQGYEGRIIRIILKATKIMDIDKGLLDDINYEGEKTVLLSFIDAIEPILKDTTHPLFVDGKFNFDKDYYTQPEISQMLVDGITVLFGSYPNEDYAGSKLVETLLPNLYDKFIQDAVPVEFEEIVSILDLGQLSGAQLASDLRRLVYVVQKLVDMDIQTILNGQDVVITDHLQSMQTIFDVLFDIQMFKAKEADVLAWALNYGAGKFLPSYNFHASSELFDDIDWLAQNEASKAILADIIDFLKGNNLETTKEIQDFVKNQDFTSPMFLTEGNVQSILNILEKVTGIRVIEVLYPVMLDVAVDKLGEKGYYLGFWKGAFTADELSQDIHSLINILRTAVQDVHVIDYWQNSFQGDLPLPLQSAVNAIIEKIFALNLIQSYEPSVFTAVLNKVLKEDFLIQVSDFDFYSVNWSNEVNTILDIINVIYLAFEENNLTVLQDIRDFIDQKWFQDAAVLRDENAKLTAELLRVAANSKLLENVFPKVLDYGFGILKDKANIDVTFLTGFTGKELTADLNNIAGFIDKAVDFGVIGLVLRQELDNIDTALLAEMVTDLYQLNLVNKNTTKLVVEGMLAGLKAAKITDFTVYEADFKGINWETEFSNFSNIVLEIGKLLTSANLTSYADIKDFIAQKDYMNQTFITNNHAQLVLNVVDLLAQSRIATVFLPYGLEKGIEFADQAGYDISFVKDQLSKEELASDVVSVVQMGRNALDFGILELVFDKTLSNIDVSLLNQIVGELRNINLLQIANAEWATLIINKAATLLKLTIHVELSDFNQVDFAAENATVQQVITNIGKLLQDTNLTSYQDILDFVKNQDFMNGAFLNENNGTTVVDILDGAVTSKIVQLLLPFGFEYGVKQLDQAGYHFTYILDTETDEKLIADANALVRIMRDFISFGGLEIAFHDGDINYHQFNQVHNMVSTLGELHILNDHFGDVVRSLLMALKIDTTKMHLDGLRLGQEVDNINELLAEVKNVLMNLNINHISEFKSFQLDTMLTLNDTFNDRFASIASILNVVAEDALLEQILFPVMDQYITGRVGNLANLVDVNNIYSNYGLFAADLLAIARSLDGVIQLNPYGFLVEEANYPFGEEMIITTLIQDLFGLNYLNQKNRLQTIFDALSTLLPKLDFSSIDATSIDLSGDKDKLIAMYQNLAQILTDPAFPIHNKYDWANIGNQLNFFVRSSVIDHFINAFDQFLATSIYRQTGPAIFLALVPVLKQVAPDYYNALDLESLTQDELKQDMEHFENIYETFKAMDISGMVSGDNIDMVTFEQNLKDILDDFMALHLFKDNLSNLVNLALRDFVNGKTFGEFDIATNAFTATGINWEWDLTLTLKDAITNVFAIFRNENINDMLDIKQFFSRLNVMEFLKDNENAENLADLLINLTDLTILKVNGLAIMNTFGVPLLSKTEIHSLVDFSRYTNEQFVYDAEALALIFQNAVKFGLSDILNNQTIVYDQIYVVKQTFNAIGRMNYFQYNLGAVIDYLTGKLGQIDLSQIDVNKLNFQNDMALLADVYEKILPVLSDKTFIAQTLNDWQHLTVTNDDLLAMKGVALDNANQLADAYHLLVQTSFAPYVVSMAYDKLTVNLQPQYKELLEILDILSLNYNETVQDLYLTSGILYDMIDFGLIDYLQGKSVSLGNMTPIKDLLAKILDANMVQDKEADIIGFVLNQFNIKIDVDVLASNLDVQHEYDIICKVLDEVAIALENNDLAMLQTLIDFIQNKDYEDYQPLLTETNANSVLNIVDILTDSKLFENAALPFAQEKLSTLVKLPENLQGLKVFLELAEYSDQTFIADIRTLIEVGKTILNSGIASYIGDRNKVIDYTNPGFTQIIENMTNLNGLTYYGQLFVEVLGDILKVDTTSFDNTNVNYRFETSQYVSAYLAFTQILMRSDFPYKTAQDYADLLKNRTTFAWRYFISYEVGSSLVNALDQLVGTGLSEELLSVTLHVLSQMEAIPGNGLLNPQDLTKSEIGEDYQTMMKLAQTALDFIYNNGEFSRLGKDSSLDNIDAAQKVVDILYELNLFADNKSDIVMAVLQELGVNTSDIDLSAVNYVSEKAIAKQMIVEVLNGLHEYDIHSYKQLYNLASELKSLWSTNKQELLKKAKDILVTINAEHVVRLVEIFDESTLLDQILLPLYNKYILTNVPESLYDLMNLAGYGSLDLAGDMHYIALAVRALYDSKVYNIYLYDQVLSEEAIEPLQRMVKALMNLTVLDMKKQQIVNTLDDRFPKLDLSGLNISQINLAADGEIIAQLIPMIYDIYLNSNAFKFRVDMLGKTPLMVDIINLYDQLLTLETASTVAPWAVKQFVLPIIEKLIGSPRFNDTTDAQIMNLLHDSVVALHAMVEMGVFSNHGIDFTNTSALQTIANVISANIRLTDQQQHYLDRIVENMNLFGVVALDYSGVSTEKEFNAFQDIIKVINDFVTKYSSAISKRDLSVLAQAETQADLTNLFEKLLQSSIIGQTFLPFMDGMVQVVTTKYVSFSMFTGMSNEEFLAVALPDIYALINSADRLGLFSGSIHYKDTDAIMDIVNVIVNSPLTANNCNAILLSVLKAVNMDIRSYDFSSVDFKQEAKYLENFLAIVKAALNLPGVDITKPDTMLTNEFMEIFSLAGKELIGSTVFETLANPVVQKLAPKILTKYPELLELVQDILNDPAYTNVLLVEDYAVMLDMLKDVVALGYFDGGIDYSNLTPLKALAEKGFGLHVFSGREARIIRIFGNSIGFIKNLQIDYDSVTDWNQEKIAILNTIDVLAKLVAVEGFDIQNPSAEMFEDKAVQQAFVDFVAAVSTSVLGQKAFPALYEQKIEPQLGEDYAGIINFKDESFTPDKWADEFAKLFDIYTLLKDCGFGGATLTATFAQTIELFDKVFGTGIEAGLLSVVNDRETWMKRFMDKGVMPMPNGTVIDMTAVVDWNNETALLRAVIVALAEFTKMETVVTEFDYALVHKSIDYAKMEALLLAISKPYSIRDSLVTIIGDAVSANSGSTDGYFNLKALLTAEFQEQYDNKKLDEAYWTNTEIAYLAKLIATANNIGADALDFLTVALGNDAADVKDQNPYVVTTAGLKQFLQLMNYSKTFAIASVQGEGGIFEVFFQKTGFVQLERPLGVVTIAEAADQETAWDQEIAAIIQIMVDARTSNLFEKNVDMIGKLKELDNTVLETILKDWNNSEIFREMLPAMAFKTLVSALVAKVSGMTEETAKQLISTKYAWLSDQQAGVTASKAEWDQEITVIVGYIKNGFPQ